MDNAQPPTPAVEILLRCARGDAAADAANAARVRALLNAGLDAEALFTLAQWHGLTPLVWDSLSALGGATLPAAVSGPFETAVRSNGCP